MVNLNPPKPPEMTEVEGQLYRPEDVEAARARVDNRVNLTGYVDPTPVGVPRATDNRRRTLREVYLDGGAPEFDPGVTVLARTTADEGDPAAQVTTKDDTGQAAATGGESAGESDTAGGESKRARRSSGGDS